MRRNKFSFNRWGLTESPLNHHVSLTLVERKLLGTVHGCDYNDTLGAFILTVRHFNGEPWPINPTALSVEVIR